MIVLIRVDMILPEYTKLQDSVQCLSILLSCKVKLTFNKEFDNLINGFISVIGNHNNVNFIVLSAFLFTSYFLEIFLYQKFHPS